MNVPQGLHQPLIRWLAALRRRPLWQRAALAFAITGLAVLARVAWLSHNLEAGRDLLLLLVALLSLLFGFVPGLVAGLTARGLSMLWLVSPGIGSTVIAPWSHLGVAAILLVTIIAAALAGQVILLLAERDDPDQPPR